MRWLYDHWYHGFEVFIWRLVSESMQWVAGVTAAHRIRNLLTYHVHPYLPLTVAKLWTLKNSPIFGRPWNIVRVSAGEIIHLQLWHGKGNRSLLLCSERGVEADLYVQSTAPINNSVWAQYMYIKIWFVGCRVIYCLLSLQVLTRKCSLAGKILQSIWTVICKRHVIFTVRICRLCTRSVTFC